MRQEVNSAGAAGTRLFAHAAITLVALLLVYAAFDDITTDNATTFHVEYAFLAGCAVWLLFVAGSLIRGGHRPLGFASLVALGSALWAQHAIVPGGIAPGFRPEYLVMMTAYCWFWALASVMFCLAWPARSGRAGKHLADAGRR